MDLAEILDRNSVKPDIQADNKTDAIKELIDLLAANKAIVEPDAALQAVLEREQVRTTGIGQGLALPHGKYAHGTKPVMAIGIRPGGIDFESVDGRPVDIIVLMVSPNDQIARHIQALARISRFLSFDTFRRDLRNAKTGEEIYKVVMDKEAEVAASAQP